MAEFRVVIQLSGTEVCFYSFILMKNSSLASTHYSEVTVRATPSAHCGLRRDSLTVPGSHFTPFASGRLTSATPIRCSCQISTAAPGRLGLLTAGGSARRRQGQSEHRKGKPWPPQQWRWGLNVYFVEDLGIYLFHWRAARVHLGRLQLTVVKDVFSEELEMLTS